MVLYDILNLTKKYETRKVLDIPSLSIEKGKIHALLGPNGAGKTTFLDILGFLERSTTGSIAYNSHPVNYSSSAFKVLRKNIVLVDQYPILFTSTVFKNIEFGLKVRKLSTKERTKKIEEVLDMVGMQYFIHSRAHTLSGGETQRVAIARALAVNPQVLLCDEPTSNVDTENQTTIINILKQVNEQKGITIIFTSHNWRQVASLAHQTMNLNHGKLTDAVIENIFSAVLSKENNDTTRYLIQDKISLFSETIQTGKKTIFIDPEKIILLGTANKTKKDNSFIGKIKQVSEDKGQIRVIIDIGIWITMRISKDIYKENMP
ncbi:MAG: ATP-binding cassette domain-containing protein, partial [Deltaproteobacteria bacterium]|nr:ATP-binding cassette domain-containing protein [Deltaproteobacteria bacterium]